MVLLTSCRDPADNAPARPDWRTPSYCANLQAPRDTWVQLRTASLVEPTHHVSVCPPAVCFFVFEMFLTTPIFSPPSVSSTFPRPPLLFILFFVFVPLLSLWLEQTVLPHISSPWRSEAVLNQPPMCTSALLSHQIWSPPSYATAQILHGLPLVTTGTRHLSARTKLKCNSHFTIIVIVIMRHSLTFFFPKAAFIFYFFLCSFANQSLPYFVWLFFLFFFISSLYFAVSVIGTPEGLLTNHGCQLLLFLCCAGVCGPSCCCSVGWKILGTYSSLSSPSVTTKTYWLMLPNFLTTRYQHRVLT